MEPIRVLHVIGSMNMGGAETLLINIYRKIDRTKVQFDFLVNRDGIFDDEIKSMGGRIYKINPITKIGHFGYKKKLGNFYKQHKEYTIVHSHINQVSGLILSIAKNNNIPVRIAHSHSTNSTNNLIVRIYKKYLGNYLICATDLFACSKLAAKWLFKDRWKDTTIIKNGIDIEKFKYDEKTRIHIRNLLSIKEDKLVIGHVGRFSEVKNHKFLIDIFYELQKIKPDSKLILVGIGDLMNAIKSKVAKLGISDKVLFLGLRNDINDIYQAMDVFVFPSLYEGFGNVVIESQISGLRTIVSDTIPEETFITKLITSVPLKETVNTWVNVILKYSNKVKRNIVNKELKNSEFNVLNISKWMEAFYLNCIKR